MENLPQCPAGHGGQSLGSEALGNLLSLSEPLPPRLWNGALGRRQEEAEPCPRGSAVSISLSLPLSLVLKE